MKRALALGAAIAAVAMTAQAQPAPDQDRVVVRHGFAAHGGTDANGDGWLSRDESAASADRMFAELDGNSDGRLTDEDHRARLAEFDIRIDGPHAPEAMDDDNCTRTETGDGDDRRVTIVCRAERVGGRERRVERHVMRGHGGADAPHPPMPPHPPMAAHAPMVFILGGEDNEADLNGDDALSREEFRAQQLRFFDASDANGDGRIRMPRPPAAPQAPTPPAPPSPPRR